MKTTAHFLSALSATCLLALPSDTVRAGDAWQTLADFPSMPFTAVDALTKDAAGNLYAAVSASDAQGRMHALVRKSSDDGTTWAVVEDSMSAVRCSIKFLGLGADPAGHVFTVGYATDEKGRMRWIVRKSGKNGSGWSTADDFASPHSQGSAAHAFATDVAGNLYVAGYDDESSSDGMSGRRAHWLVRQSRDGGRSWSTIDNFGYNFSAKAAAIMSTSNGLFVAGSGWNGKSESGERWLVRKGTVDGTGGFRWKTVDEFQMKEHGHGYNSLANGLGVDGLGNLYAVGRSYAVANSAVSAHWIVRRASGTGSDWTVVDTFQLDPGYFAEARGITLGRPKAMYVVGRTANRDSGSHWIVRQSATGEEGSWSMSDDFQLLPKPTAFSQVMDLIIKAVDGSMTSWPEKNCRGLAILSDSRRVFAGGSAETEVGHAIVRKLESGHASKVTNTSAR